MVMFLISIYSVPLYQERKQKSMLAQVECTKLKNNWRLTISKKRSLKENSGRIYSNKENTNQLTLNI